MLMSIDEIIGYQLKATDGVIGKIKDFYFDDIHWIIRYLVADTRKWLPGRKVLISPESIGEYNWLDGRELPIRLSTQEIEDSPPIDTDEPVSRQKEQALADLFSWTIYWRDHLITGVPESEIADAADYVSNDQGDPNLRSVSEINGYRILATDGEAGRVDDFIVETDDWSIRYVVVDTKHPLDGKKTLLAKDWMGPVKWKEKEIITDRSLDQIRNSPEFDPEKPVNHEVETRLYDYYGRPVYE